jgi:heme exporter protein D
MSMAFWHMGGYAPYVWTAYGLWLIVLVGNIATARAAHREALKQAERRIAMRGEAP